MDPEKRKRLEAAGFKFGDAADFLGLTETERQIVEVRVGLARAVRLAREAKGMTQKDLATAIGSSQSRVAKIESAAGDVTVDLMLKALFTVGGRLPAGLASPEPKAESKVAVRPTAKKKA
jgi:DNA-binding XRE family transcriptional regulator